MEFVRITRLDDPFFARLHELLGKVFPPEEVLAFDAWRDPLADEGLRVCVAVENSAVVGATEYRYYPMLKVAMTDFTIIARGGLGIGRFLWEQRQADLHEWAQSTGGGMLGMFAEIYDPAQLTFESLTPPTPMHPMVRREVLSHLGYWKLGFPYIHPSWQQDGAEVSGLDLCFRPEVQSLREIPADLVATFIETYYAILPQRPPAWYNMVQQLRSRNTLPLLPL